MQDSEFAAKVGIILDSIVQDIEDQDPEGEIDIDLKLTEIFFALQTGFLWPV